MNPAADTKKELLRNLLILVLIILAYIIFSKIRSHSSNEVSLTQNATQAATSYLLYVPDTYNPESPVPLVITLHGYTSNSSQIAATSHWNQLADDEGFLVVYPQGSGDPPYWHTSSISYNGRSSQMEVEFIAGIIDELQTQYTIDPSRIYVNGLSMGGGMSHVLACQLADRIAAVGSVAGAYAYPDELCEPSRPVPFIMFHGTNDTVIPYEGGYFCSHSATYPTIPQFAEDWAARNYCTDQRINPQQGEISSRMFSNCDQGADVVLYTVHGGGHTWPGDSTAVDIPDFHVTQQIDATLLMWDFFMLHPLQNGLVE